MNDDFEGCPLVDLVVDLPMVEFIKLEVILVLIDVEIDLLGWGIYFNFVAAIADVE